MKIYVLILLFLLFIGGCIYDDSVEDNYGNSIILFTGDIIYNIGFKKYESVWLYQDITGDNILYEKFKAQGEDCNETDYGIGGGRGCTNITGYTHTYIIPKRGLQIEAYRNALPDYINNPGIFIPSIISPFMLSGNRLYDSYGSGILSDHYITYNTVLSGQSINNILENAPDKIVVSNKLYKKRISKEYIDNTVMYQDINEEGNNVTMMMKYIIQTGQNYYYTIFDSSVGCAPGPCGMDRHKITYFLK